MSPVENRLQRNQHCMISVKFGRLQYRCSWQGDSLPSFLIFKAVSQSIEELTFLCAPSLIILRKEAQTPLNWWDIESSTQDKPKAAGEGTLQWWQIVPTGIAVSPRAESRRRSWTCSPAPFPQLLVPFSSQRNPQVEMESVQLHPSPGLWQLFWFSWIPDYCLLATPMGGNSQ